VDRELYNDEESQWGRFHEEQSSAVFENPFSPLPEGARDISANNAGENEAKD
jgi:hypothetical protein